MTHREVSLIAVNIGRKNNPIKKKNSYKKKKKLGDKSRLHDKRTT